VPEVSVVTPLRAVIDTNVFVSAFLRENTPPSRVLGDVLRGALLVLYDKRILDEYRDVLFRPKFPFERDRLDRFVQFVQRRGQSVESAHFAERLADPDDQCFADVAFTGDADVLITGNVKDFPVGRALRVITPRQWVHIAERADRFREAGDNERFALEEFDQATFAVAKACKKCGYVEVTDVFGFTPRSGPVLIPFRCARPDPKGPDGRCGGEQWSYDDNDLGRRLAVAYGIPVAPR
jgi:putative PIN family toxin of toxin-antitoxin system